jgi:ACR3 family arsenite efflux pump ArsB
MNVAALQCELLELNNGQESNIVLPGDAPAAAYGLVFQKLADGDFELTIPNTAVHAMSNPM